MAWTITLTAPPSGAAILAGETVAVPLTTGAIAGHRLRDGTLAWTTELPAEQPLAADAEHVYVASGEAVHALRAATGAPRWRVPAGGGLTAPPFAHSGWVLAAAADQLLAIRASDGSVVWKKTVGAVEFRPAVDGDLLVVPTNDGYLLALDIRTGAERWRYNAGSAPIDPFVIGDRVYAGTAGKHFIAVNASTGRKDWIVQVGALVRGHAAADERHVYFNAVDNTVRALDRRSGAIKWRQGLLYRPSAGPVLLSTGVVAPGINIASLPVFNRRTGAPAGQIAPAQEFVRVPVFGRGADDLPRLFAITGGLDETWSLALMVPSQVPSFEVQPLTALPGEPVPAPQAPQR